MDQESNVTGQQPDVIRHQIEETRSSLTDKLETFEQEVKDTVRNATNAVSDTIATVRNTVEDTVESVKGTMEDTLISVKQTFDIPRQVDRHPCAMVSGSVALGFVVGRLLPRTHSITRAMSESFRSTAASVRTPQTNGMGFQAVSHIREEDAAPPYRGSQEAKPGMWHGLATQFAPEIDKIKGLAIGSVMALLRDVLKQSVPPNVSRQVEGIIDDVTTKLGGQPVSGPLVP